MLNGCWILLFFFLIMSSWDRDSLPWRFSIWWNSGYWQIVSKKNIDSKHIIFDQAIGGLQNSTHIFNGHIIALRLTNTAGSNSVESKIPCDSTKIAFQTRWSIGSTPEITRTERRFGSSCLTQGCFANLYKIFRITLDFTTQIVMCLIQVTFDWPNLSNLMIGQWLIYNRLEYS